VFGLCPHRREGVNSDSEISGIERGFRVYYLASKAIGRYGGFGAFCLGATKGGVKRAIDNLVLP
jgi:hypothetical protein